MYKASFAAQAHLITFWQLPRLQLRLRLAEDIAQLILHLLLQGMKNRLYTDNSSTFVKKCLPAYYNTFNRTVGSFGCFSSDKGFILRL